MRDELKKQAALAAAARAVGLRQYADDFVDFEQRLERGQREFRRPGEGHAQG